MIYQSFSYELNALPFVSPSDKERGYAQVQRTFFFIKLTRRSSGNETCTRVYRL